MIFSTSFASDAALIFGGDESSSSRSSAIRLSGPSGVPNGPFAGHSSGTTSPSNEPDEDDDDVTEAVAAAAAAAAATAATIAGLTSGAAGSFGCAAAAAAAAAEEEEEEAAAGGTGEKTGRGGRESKEGAPPVKATVARFEGSAGGFSGTTGFSGTAGGFSGTTGFSGTAGLTAVVPLFGLDGRTGAADLEPASSPLYSSLEDEEEDDEEYSSSDGSEARPGMRTPIALSEVSETGICGPLRREEGLAGGTGPGDAGEGLRGAPMLETGRA